MLQISLGTYFLSSENTFLFKYFGLAYSKKIVSKQLTHPFSVSVSWLEICGNNILTKKTF